MAWRSTCIYEANGAGSDNNGGAFEPAHGSVTFNTDLAADTNTGNTASPVVSSATYNFVAGDVGHFLYVRSGTNWIPGWYQIASVASNKATLTASVGTVLLYNQTDFVNTTAGCASVATPTGGSWTIDYTRGAAAKANGTDLVIDGTTNTKITSATYTFTKADVGNAINVTAGTGFTLKEYQICSVTAGAATVEVSVGTLGSTGGTWYLGGAKGKIETVRTRILANGGFSAFFTGAFSPTGSAIALANLSFVGYAANRWDNGLATVNAAGMTAGQNTFTAGNVGCAANFSVSNSKNYAFAGSGNHYLHNCRSTGATTGGFLNINGTLCYSVSDPSGFVNCYGLRWCVAKTTTTGHGFGASAGILGSMTGCVAWNCGSSGTVHGFNLGNVADQTVANCVAYGSRNNGFNFSGQPYAQVLSCAAYGNGGYGFGGSAPNYDSLLRKCFAGNNTSGSNQATTRGWNSENVTLLTGDPFTNAAGGDFSLNNTAGAGALLRAAGGFGLPGISTNDYLDVGAAQHQDSGGGGSTGGGGDQGLIIQARQMMPY